MAFRLIVFAVVVLFVRSQILDAIAQWRAHPTAHSPSAVSLFLSALAYAGSMLVSCIFWWILILRLGGSPGYWPTFMAYVVGHLGKYAPGKALVLVLRAGLLKGHRTDPAIATVAIFVETLTIMAVGAFLAGILLAIRFHDRLLYLVVALGLMAVTGIPIMPPVFRRILGLLGITRRYIGDPQRLSPLNWSVMGEGWLIITLSWAIQGLSLWVLLLGMGQKTPVSELPWITAGLAFSIVAGFVSFMPGGLGAREAVLAEWLKLGGIPDEVGVVAALLLRLTNIGAEAAIGALLYPFYSANPGALAVDKPIAPGAMPVEPVDAQNRLLPVDSTLPQNTNRMGAQSTNG